MSGRTAGRCCSPPSAARRTSRRSSGKRPCFYRLPVDGGEARKAFEVPLNVAAIRPLGGGKYLVNAVVDLNEPPEDMDETLRGR